MALNAGLANSLESSIGPASEPIALRTFIRSDVSTLRAADLPSSQEDIAQECDVSDIQESIQNTWDNIKQSGHLLKDHEVFVTNAIIAADSKRKRRRIINYDEPTQQPSDLKELQDSLALASKRLKSFPYPPEAALFMRAPKNSDFNVLMQVRPSLNSEKRPTPGAILKITIHNPLSWGHNYLSRASTHLLHSSNTLEDLFDLLLCPSNEIPEETDEDNEVEERSQVDPSYVICVEGLAYPGGPSTPDYADLLIEHNNLLAQETRPILVKASTSAPDTKFKSLTLKLNEAYYILHHGNCEHYFVVEEIRLQNPNDRSPYPLTTCITPVLLDLCRSCCKVPAVVAITGDVRLPESPCVLCQFCWDNMGPSDDDEVCVVPLPKHVHGWETQVQIPAA